MEFTRFDCIALPATCLHGLKLNMMMMMMMMTFSIQFQRVIASFYFLSFDFCVSVFVISEGFQISRFANATNPIALLLLLLLLLE